MPSVSLQLPPFSSPAKHTNTFQSNKPQSIDSLRLLPEDPFRNSMASVQFLNSYAANRDLKSAACIHAGVLKSGFDADVFVGNSLLDAYVKCRNLEDAVRLFDRMPERNVVSWTSMISGQCQSRLHDTAISTFKKMLESGPPPNEFTLSVMLQACTQKQNLKMGEMIHGYIIRNGYIRDQFIQNSLIDMYSKSGSLVAAGKLMDRLSCRDVVSWTSVISGFVVEGLIEKALVLFFQMQEDGVMPNAVTIISIIHAVSLVNEWRFFRWIHGWVVKTKLGSDPFVVNSLVEMYSRNGFVEGVKIFGQFCFTGERRYLNPETMATLVQDCAHSGSLKWGKGIHGFLIKNGFFPCIMVENSLIDMYAKTKQVDSAYQLFTMMNGRDVISWNTMLLCYVKNDRPCDALQLLTEIHTIERDVLAPDFVTMLSSLQACAELASLQQGQIIHGYITKSGFGCDVFIGNSLIDMYAKSGRIDFAKWIFEDMPTRDLASWNSMIAAYGIHGDGISALWVFRELERFGAHPPNAITFLNVLTACGHSGLVKEGYACFNKMTRDYGIEPSMEHFACMVDLLGRSGRLKEAEDFIEEMPMRPGLAVWGALLGACALFGEIEIAERVVERLSVLDPGSKAWRVVMSNVYAAVGRWEDAVRLREEMRGGEGPRKEAGWSCVEVRGESFRFMVGDTRHPKSTTIYETLNGIGDQIRDNCFGC
ncbi:pentatricopeptide repeat-containing protein At1g06140, mitochondrial-like [Magnolia sinica]|uniref:pentatricopeptide repeat-containing protein At1g06140, mitochondrial-like n=1 Tax=Magnolia sinica TaxID=86752 RepID=UPI002657ECD2|nr:pentatricopeptide repeat-containing protein At1g06140, mitochondrial-like [Magnolia sinica]